MAPAAPPVPAGTPDEQLAAYEASCAQGAAETCDAAGTMRSIGPNALRNHEQAMALYRKACAGGSGVGCTNLALQYRIERDDQRNHEQAEHWYTVACSLGYADGCAGLGDMYEHQVAFGAKDSTIAAKHYEKACNLGSAVGCAALAELVAAGRGTARDAARARELNVFACGCGSSYGCLGAARMFQESDPSVATKLFTQAAAINTSECDKGDPYYCSLLGDAYRDGKGVPRDANRAVHLYQYGCRNGMKAGCEGLRSLVQGFQDREGGQAAEE